ncbi:hypothetical protein F5148DRAFT_977089 [Russula earlei]|uniref:Uncharacterized protein n=1 Tax=Russula earlei TaxID=71964 RepID=A0ACC0UF34_9AGAM|nr:hypothetical protein F5148DRAFT_977089 [Russula earlei]
MPSEVTATVVDDNPEAYEQRHVHAVYDHIASHFSSTRYKPWPLIAKFLLNIPAGWVGLDSGTGNGKYLDFPTDYPGKFWTVGLDRSQNLLDIARTAGGSGKIREVVRGDVLGRGWRRGAFDYAISIATIHHLATLERRVVAVKPRHYWIPVSPTHGRILIYVWAIEQDEHSKRTIPVPGQVRTCADGGEESPASGQDVFVPWVLSLVSGNAISKVPTTGQSRNISKNTPNAIRRYYHMFSKGELLGLVQNAAQEMGLRVGRPSNDDADQTNVTDGVEIVSSGWERSNYYVELQRWQR